VVELANRSIIGLIVHSIGYNLILLGDLLLLLLLLLGLLAVLAHHIYFSHFCINIVTDTAHDLLRSASIAVLLAHLIIFAVVVGAADLVQTLLHLGVAHALPSLHDATHLLSLQILLVLLLL